MKIIFPIYCYLLLFGVCLWCDKSDSRLSKSRHRRSCRLKIAGLDVHQSFLVQVLTTGSINHPTSGGLEELEFVSMACDHQERAHARTRQRLSKFDEEKIDEAEDQIQASGFHVHPFYTNAARELVENPKAWGPGSLKFLFLNARKFTPQ